ncbi:hypothetical protein SELMODRAFT_408262 [Selaginella moellendorffii]|uniref:Uncharacterized protein n=1 Tax=Selaginella moellendorffii TaxID=88036 RepID=D8R7R0_SELML|nr:hypothetical protein SELMODRAFT_408262 [Selaginella moellendorffii]
MSEISSSLRTPLHYHERPYFSAASTRLLLGSTRLSSTIRPFRPAQAIPLQDALPLLSASRPLQASSQSGPRDPVLRLRHRVLRSARQQISRPSQRKKPRNFLLSRSSSLGSCAAQVATHHSAADGVATADFVKAWALISSGQEHRVNPPHLERSLLLQPDAIPPESTPAEYQIEPPPFPDPRNVERAILSFTSSGIRSLLKSDTTATLPAAHLWIAITRARTELSLLQPHERG